MICHLLPAREWVSRHRSATCAFPGQDEFLDCCDERQLAPVREACFPSGPKVVPRGRPTLLSSETRYEPGSGGEVQRFPPRLRANPSLRSHFAPRPRRGRLPCAGIVDLAPWPGHVSMRRTTIRIRTSGDGGTRVLPSVVPPSRPTTLKEWWGTLSLIRTRAPARKKASSGPRGDVAASPSEARSARRPHMRNLTVRSTHWALISGDRLLGSLSGVAPGTSAELEILREES